MMSEQDVKTLHDVRNSLKIQKHNGFSTRQGKESAIADAKAKLMEYQSMDYELTIRLHQSTINQLKTLSWDLFQRKDGSTVQ